MIKDILKKQAMPVCLRQICSVKGLFKNVTFFAHTLRAFWEEAAWRDLDH